MSRLTLEQAAQSTAKYVVDDLQRKFGGGWNLLGAPLQEAIALADVLHRFTGVIGRPNGSRPGRQNGSGLVVRKGSPSAPPIGRLTARAGGVKGLKAEGFLAKPTLDAPEHAGTDRMPPDHGSSQATRT